jgi:hypothetical protein
LDLVGHPFRADVAKERSFRQMHQKNSQVRSNSYMVWFVGAVVWGIDAALHVYAGSRAHAVLAIAISLLFLMAGVFFRRQALRK